MRARAEAVASPPERGPDTASRGAGGEVAALLARGSVVLLTGAGLSTSCGIPDYRDHAGRWKRGKPIDHGDFLRHEATRRRYWTRSFFGWPRLGGATPGAGHRALARLEDQGRIALVITQNVDGLHQKAGSRRVLELHGGLGRVVCLECNAAFPRAAVQQWMEAANPGIAHGAAGIAPDGDADVPEALHANFRIPDCPACAGVLKPDVVFFGDSVPRDRVALAMSEIDRAGGLLVIGSSLMVYSGFRFVEHARRQGKPVMAINLGTTRADHLFDAKVEEDCDQFLQALRDAA